MGLLASIGTILGAMVVVSVVAIAIRRLVAPERSPMMKRDIFFDFIILGFAIVVGLVIVVEFEAFSDAQRSAETEAESVWLTVQEAKALRVAERDRVQRVAICYGRSVVEDDWDELATGSRSQKTNAIATSAYDELARLRNEGVADSNVLNAINTSLNARGDARAQRVLAADTQVTPLMWIFILGSAFIIVAWTLVGTLGESLPIQLATVISVTFFAATLIVLILQLENPFSGIAATLEPEAMREVLRDLSAERSDLLHIPASC